MCVVEEEFVKLWNSLPDEIPKVQKMTAERKRKFKLRLKDKWWRDNWKKAIAKIPEVPFLLGKNKTGWTANADYFFQTNSVAKILEGVYNTSEQKPVDLYEQQYGALKKRLKNGQI